MSYYALLSIYKEAAKELERFKHQPPVQCPNDGTELIKKDDGTLFCRFDGWVWNGINNVNGV